MKEYTRAVLARARELERQEAALLALPRLRRDWRPALAGGAGRADRLCPRRGGGAAATLILILLIWISIY